MIFGKEVGGWEGGWVGLPSAVVVLVMRQRPEAHEGFWAQVGGWMGGWVGGWEKVPSLVVVLVMRQRPEAHEGFWAHVGGLLAGFHRGEATVGRKACPLLHS